MAGLLATHTSVLGETTVRDEEEASADAVIVPPGGTLEVRQKMQPLDTPMNKVGNAPVNMDRRLSPMVMASIERPNAELRTAALQGLTSTHRNRLGRVVQYLKTGNPAAGQREWQSLIRQLSAMPAGASMDINALIQSVLRQAYVETNEDLRFYAEKVQYFNELKQTTRAKLQDARKQNTSLTTTNRTKSVQSRGGSTATIQSLEQELQTVGDDAQLANIDLQNSLQRQQQTLQTMSNVSKMLHDTAMAIVRKIG